jgi:hypothetical protein
MKRFLIISLLLLTGCASTSVPVVPPFPDVPDSLKQACPNLKTVDENTTKLSEMLETITNNYHRYYDCKSQVDDWIEWYNTQKSIYGKIK